MAPPMSPLALFGGGDCRAWMQVCQYYGMTETSGRHFGGADHDPSRAHLMRSVGKPAAFPVEICWPDNSVCDDGARRNLYSIARKYGYANRLEATMRSFGEWYRRRRRLSGQ